MALLFLQLQYIKKQLKYILIIRQIFKKCIQMTEKQHMQKLQAILQSIRFLEKKSERQQSESNKKIKRPKSVSANRQGYMKSMSQYTYMNSIKRAVKNNDISFLVQKKQSRLLTDPSDAPFFTFEDASHNKLIEVRKKYDSMKKQRINKLQYTQALKSRVKTLQSENIIMKQVLQEDQNKTKNKKQKLDKLIEQLEAKYFDRDILINMKKRLHQDIQYYKDRLVFAAQKDKRKRMELSQKQKQYEILTREEANSHKIYKKFEQQLEFQKHYREEHIRNLLESIDYKMETLKNQATWSDFVKNTAVETLLQKDSEQKQWNNLILVNLFLKKILNSKIEVQMQKFSQIQKAFQIIKSRTQVSDYLTFIDRYLMRDKIYGQLLGKVSQNKRKIQELQSEHQKLLKQNSDLEDYKEQIENRKYQENNTQNVSQEEGHEIKKWDIKAANIQQIRINLREWVTRQILKLNRIQGTLTQQNLIVPRDTPSLTNKLNFYLDKIQSMLEKIDNEEFILSQIGQNKQKKNPKMKRKQQRPEQMVLASQEQKTDAATRKNSQIYQIEEQSFILNAQRNQIHQKNERFLKDARIKYNTTRRQFLQKQVKTLTAKK